MHALRQHGEESSDEDDEEPQGQPSRREGRSKAPKKSAVQESIAALTQTMTQLVAAVGKGNPSSRSNSPAARKPKFVWKGGSHECGGDRMKRDCSKWKKLMAENDNKIPDGHVNAYTKARDAHNKKHGITPSSNSASQKRSNSPKDKANRRANIKALLAELEMDSDFSGSDSEGSNTEFCKALRTCHPAKTYVNALMQGTPTKNRYGALETDDDKDDVDELAILNTWAHKVTMKTKNGQKKIPKRKVHMNVIIQNEKDFDKVID